MIHNALDKQEEKLNERIRRRSLSARKTNNKNKENQDEKIAKIYKALGQKLMNFA